MDIEKKDKNYILTISETEFDVIKEILNDISHNHAFNRFQPMLSETVKTFNKIKY